jgi:hypothetical protein
MDQRELVMLCSICKDPLLAQQTIRTCEVCEFRFHADCWNENGGCGTPGCANLPTIQRKQNIEGATYYGATTKACPACGETIKVNEINCVYCREQFHTIEPITSDELKEKLTWRPPQIEQNKGALTVFLCSLLGFTAPFNLLFGGIWYWHNGKVLRDASPVHNLLAVTGLLISALYFFIILLGILSY